MMAMVMGLLKLGLAQEYRLGTFWQLGIWAPKLSQTAKSYGGCRLAASWLAPSAKERKRSGTGPIITTPRSDRNGDAHNDVYDD